MTEPPAEKRARQPGKFWPWLAGCALHAVAVAWLACSLERHTAPFLVFPLAVGLALGVGVVALAKWCQIERRNVLLTGALMAATITVVGQHYFAYWHARETLQQAAERRVEALAKFPGLATQVTSRAPESFVDFLASEARRGREMPGSTVAIGVGVWLSWLVDALLVASGAALLVWIASTNSPRPLDEPPRER
ncbi:MAG: hypothetical protein KF708_17510 [Pirellulales bacterium]|nr:hypothetical protein [Pirellulales bacterium]